MSLHVYNWFLVPTLQFVGHVFFSTRSHFISTKVACHPGSHINTRWSEGLKRVAVKLFKEPCKRGLGPKKYPQYKV